MVIRYKISNRGLTNVVHEYPKLGYPINSPEHLELKNIMSQIREAGFIVYSPSAFGLGDSIVLTTIPKILKRNYPNLKFYLLSYKSLVRLFGGMKDQWNSWNDPFTNVEVSFRNNPYVDGYLDLEDFEGTVITNHDVIYDPNKLDEPIVEQICRFFNVETTPDDIAPELYFDKNDNYKVEIGKDYGVFVLSNRFWDTEETRRTLQAELDKFKDLPFLYFDKTTIFNYNRAVNIIEKNPNIRQQLNLYSKAKVCLGFQTGVLDAVCRYTDVRVLPHWFHMPRGWQFQPRETYLKPI